MFWWKIEYSFYQSTENGSINRAIYSVGLNGKGKKALSSKKQEPMQLRLVPNFQYFITSFSSNPTDSLYTK
jgi:dipeptidyl-peptidase-4